MKRFAVWLLAGLLISMPVFAERLVARSGGDKATLLRDVCTNTKVKSIVIALGMPREGVAQLRAASAVLGGNTFEACWVYLQGYVYLFYEDGGVGQLPAEAFVVETGV